MQAVVGTGRLQRIDNEVKVIRIDDRLGVLRDQSVRWLWNAYRSINMVALVKRVRTCSVISVPKLNVMPGF